jgi:uncharacterized surface protein with fasciclin (FAS1) repeats/BMFP domain-containing protein YqiC
LIELGLLVKDAAGRLVQADALLSTGAETRGLHIAAFHRAMTQRAIESIDLVPPEDRDISSLTLCLSRGGLRAFKERIQRMRRELLELSALEAQPEQVAQINFQLFPLDEQIFSALSGSPLLIDTTGGVKVDDAKVKTADVVAENGVIHVIDRILLPPKDDLVATAIAAGMFTQLAGALTSADLVTTLQGKGPFTVFAPTDAAFAKLAAVPTGEALKNVLLYHVVAGAVGSGDLKAGPVPTQLSGKSVTVSLTGGVTINDAKVTTANVLAKNGVIHVVDTVLVPQ